MTTSVPGFSRIVEEALENYLERGAGREAAGVEALAVRGSLSGAEADELEERTREIREQWR